MERQGVVKQFRTNSTNRSTSRGVASECRATAQRRQTRLANSGEAVQCLFCRKEPDDSCTQEPSVGLVSAMAVVAETVVHVARSQRSIQRQ